MAGAVGTWQIAHIIPAIPNLATWSISLGPPFHARG
jgi:hypothetical protein